MCKLCCHAHTHAAHLLSEHAHTILLESSDPLRLARLLREAHVDKPLLNEAARKLGQVVRGRGNHVAHLPKQDVRDFVLCLGTEAPLRVAQRERDHLLGRRLGLWQRPPAQQQPAELVMLLPVGRTHDAKPFCGKRARQHAIGDAQAMWHDAIAVRFLDGMRDRVAVLEDHAACFFVRVAEQNGHLGFDAQVQELRQGRAVEGELFTGAAVFAVDALTTQSLAKPLGMLAAQKCGVLGELANAREKLASGQRAAKGNVDQDFERSVKGADVVLAAVEADGCLERCRHIMHSKQSRRDVDQLRAPIEHRREEARDIHQRAAAEGYHERTLGRATAEGPFHERGQIRPRLAGIAARQDKLLHGWPVAAIAVHAGLASDGCLLRSQLAKVVTMQSVHGLVGDEQDAIWLQVQDVLGDFVLHIRTHPSRHRGAVRENERQRLHRHRKK
mmetsp:Transcript_77818/g.252188  ORF Transcript_77818/g.252188 Transcript_77818/m.252188 type:complete len:444 (+) Transcript_77818:164-1495(+)